MKGSNVEEKYLVEKEMKTNDDSNNISASSDCFSKNNEISMTLASIKKIDEKDLFLIMKQKLAKLQFEVMDISNNSETSNDEINSVKQELCINYRKVFIGLVHYDRYIH